MWTWYDREPGVAEAETDKATWKWQLIEIVSRPRVDKSRAAKSA